MKIIIRLAITLLFCGCAKEKNTLYHAYFKNTTAHTIEIKPYFGGVVPSEKIVLLLANEIKEIARGTDRGIVGNAGFNSQNFSGSDSIVVVFDNIYKITHYFIVPSTTAPKFYLLMSNRNIYNKDNYAYSYQDISKYQRESNYNYEFKEQDYLDAK